MDASTREPEDAVVAYLRARAPGLPAAPFDPRAVTARARGALRRRRRRIRTSVAAVAGTTAAYLTLALAGPVPVPGGGTLSVPGGGALRAAVVELIPGQPPGPERRRAEVGRLDREVRPVVEELRIFYYLLESESCRVLEYPRGQFRDGTTECGHDLAPFDAQARADFDRVTAAVERSGVAVERIYRQGSAVYVRIPDISWQYNWEYVYLPDTDTPPASRFPEERWTRVHDAWWFHRAHDD